MGEALPQRVMVSSHQWLCNQPVHAYSFCTANFQWLFFAGTWWNGVRLRHLIQCPERTTIIGCKLVFVGVNHRGLPMKK
jgi:hypothetical protein